MPITKGGRAIVVLEDWKRYAPPKAEHQWVDGRSAKEAARAWLEGGDSTLPPEVAVALRAHPRFGPVASWDAEPEATIRFDDFPGEPRNSDLLAVVHDAQGPYVLAVEAKADESFGETIADALAAAVERRIQNPRSNGLARIAALASMLLQPRQPHAPYATTLRYQLFTACAAAVAEANRRQVDRAVLLVHEFVTPATTDEKHARNAADLDAFLSRLGPPSSLADADGSLCGPFVAAPFPAIDLFVGKVVRQLRA